MEQSDPRSPARSREMEQSDPRSTARSREMEQRSHTLFPHPRERERERHTILTIFYSILHYFPRYSKELNDSAEDR